MALTRRRLRPSYRSRLGRREQRTNSSAPSNREHRRWGKPTTERTLIGYVLSLSLMVALANLPIHAGFFGADRYAALSGDRIRHDETLPIITMHDVPKRQDSRGNALARTAVPTTSIEAVEGKAEQDAASVQSLKRAPTLRPTSPSGIPSVEETRALLRFTGGPPSVDVAPKVRVGSMIVRYPISALKKAIEGLVIVRFTVEPSGRASAVEIVKGLDPACDAEVVEAVERARFLPGKRKGREVPAYSQMTIRFVLADSDPMTAF